jgi:hypothetical protein
MQASDMIWVGRRSIVVALMLTCACPGNRRGPTRECGVAQEVCNGDVCSCQDDSTCTVQARPHCASDTASVCCNNQCTFVLAPAPAQCECIVGEVRACGNGGTQTCLDQNPGSLSAETDKSIWDPRCHEPVPPPPVETWYRDDDGDGFCGRQQASVSTPGAGWSTSCPIEPAACEGIAAVHVPSVEVPGDGIDNDCVGGDAPLRHHRRRRRRGTSRILTLMVTAGPRRTSPAIRGRRGWRRVPGESRRPARTTRPATRGSTTSAATARTRTVGAATPSASARRRPR